MEKNQDKWIEDAFKKAQPKIDGMPVKDFSEKIDRMFMDDFPHTMTAYTMSFGEDKALKVGLKMLTDHDFISLCKCFFCSGYSARMREKTEGGDSEKE